MRWYILPSQFNQHSLHRKVPLPLLQAWQNVWVDPSACVDTWEVDLGDEGHGWWLVWVVIAAMHLEGVDSILVGRLRNMLAGSPYRQPVSVKVEVEVEVEAMNSENRWKGREPYVWWAENGAVPVGHQQIISFCQTVGACLCGFVRTCLRAIHRG